MRQTVLAAVAAAFLLPAFAGVASADPSHCPPGHAKKGWCSPGPKYVYRKGDRISRDHYVVVEDYDRYGYRRPPAGYGYVRVDSDIFLIALGTGLIIEALR